MLKSILAVALALSFGAVGIQAKGWITNEDADPSIEWRNFKRAFRVNYPTQAEEDHRFEVFKTSLKRAEERNQANLQAGGKRIFGVTRFSDRTQEEFDRANKGRKGHGRIPKDFDVKMSQAASVPDSADWRSMQTPVKNQGQCGSCWAHSAAEVIESMYFILGNPIWPLSQQQINSCTESTFGCGGGDTITAYEQLLSNVTKYGDAMPGLAPAAMVPYTQSMYDLCETRRCTVSCDDDGVGNLSAMVTYESLTGPYVAISGYSYATTPCTGTCANQNLTELESNVASFGPPSICVNAGTWNDYVGGVMTTAACGGYAYSDLDHCVQLSGYDLTSEEPYFLVRNSWATSWGEEGYIKLSSSGNTCGLANEATFVDIA